MPLMACRHLTIYYENQCAVKDVSFDIEAGDYICIVGENGSGKSSLVKGLLGLVPLRTGSVTCGEGLSRNAIGYLPQQTMVQKDFPASVYEIVLSGCLSRRGLRPFYSAGDKKRALENLKSMGILELKNKSYRDLSGGQQQRVLLARALCATDQMLLLDEPVTGLDPIATTELYDLIGRINKEQGVTVIMVSHDFHYAVTHAGKILHMDEELLFYGSTEEYLRSDAYRRMTGRVDL
ncbi:MAG: metal ABC transporter ATP-binding protein [Candidatus Pararuminococcus gallinarum]|jgi:zinc transport system ATP-binding protein|uniref:metal ABC transporter ATP-binding protein n=1 Tax=Zongyangia sp. HA2173 TaxID=3133035 RepID=UPI003164A30A